MTWAFRLIKTPNGVAVHHVYFTEGVENPTSAGETPFVAEAADVEDLKYLLELILSDALQRPMIDAAELGLYAD